MIINKYRTELNEDKLNILVKEESKEYNEYRALDEAGKIADCVNSLYNLCNRAEEYVYMLALDTKLGPIAMFEVTHGTVDISHVSPREVFIRALLCGASRIVLIHNHPAGSTRPSTADITLTERMVEAGKLINVSVEDHIIVGDGYFSFRKENYI